MIPTGTDDSDVAGQTIASILKRRLKMKNRSRAIALAIALVAAAMLVVCLPAVALATPPTTLTGTVAFPAGETVYSGMVKIAPGATLTAPDGYTLTMTVNGVEKGQVLETTQGTNTVFVPGNYFGRIVFTAAEEGVVFFSPPGPPPGPGSPPPPPPLEYITRQALYVGASGPDYEKSVLSAVQGGRIYKTNAKNIKVTSTGDCFNGLFLAGDYKVWGLKLDMKGDGRSDFVGYGAAVLVTGAETKVVIDRASIKTDGVVRTGIVADEGANLVVKNSTIETRDGVLPADYNPTMDQKQMRSVPWVLGLGGNNRATNLCGNGTIASYVNSTISAEGWGVLSTDDCQAPQLNVINSVVKITGQDGYGTYGIGGATERFLGTTFHVATYGTISRGCHLIYGNSTQAAIRALNGDIGLSVKEIRAIPNKPTVVNSKRFGIMWHGDGVVDVTGGTTFKTGEAVFLDKGQALEINVDGAQGAKLLPANGVIFQLMDDDDPGPDMGPPPATNTGEFFKPYIEPAGPVVPADKDLYTPAATDAFANFKNISLKGDFWNGMRGDLMGGMGPETPRNLVLTFDHASVAGLISSSSATHAPHTTIMYPYGSGSNYPNPVPYDYRNLGTVTNTAEPAVNNGVIVTLKNGSNWTVTKSCYVTSLTFDSTSSIVAVAGKTLKVFDDGVQITPAAGTTYTGTIEMRVQ